jgi:very-short-patch-repair endonuclease
VKRSSTPGLWEKLKPLARQMRNEPTFVEQVLWHHLRGRRLFGCKFRRQHAIDRFVVDFYCAERDMIIEVDGPVHDFTPEEDALRQEYLESLGFHVLRFTNQQVLENIDDVLQEITLFLEQRSTSPSP